MIEYFVSYAHWGHDGSKGFGRIGISLNATISGVDRIYLIEAEILRLEPKMREVVVIGWQRFER